MPVRKERGQRSSHRKVERKPLGVEGHERAKMREEKKEKQRKQTTVKRKKNAIKNPDSLSVSRLYEYCTNPVLNTEVGNSKFHLRR